MLLLSLRDEYKIIKNAKSRIFLDFEKRKKVFSNYGVDRMGQRNNIPQYLDWGHYHESNLTT